MYFNPKCISKTEMVAGVTVLVGVGSAIFIMLGLCINIEPHRMELPCKGTDDDENDTNDIGHEYMPRNRNNFVQSIERSA